MNIRAALYRAYIAAGSGIIFVAGFDVDDKLRQERAL